MTRRSTVALLAASLAAAYVLAVSYSTAPLAALDHGAQALMHRAVSPALTPLVTAFTALGGMHGTLTLAAVLALGLLIRKRWRPFVGLATIVLGIRASIDGIKPLVARARPQDGIIAEAGYSFPSGHAIATAAFWGYVAWLASRHMRPGPARRIACGLALLIPVLSGLTRVYLNVHWMTDVIGGWAAGAALALAAFLLVTALEPGAEAPPAGVPSEADHPAGVATPPTVR